MRKFKENKGLFILIPALLIILSALLVPGVSSAALDGWTYTPMSGKYMQAIAYGNSTFVSADYSTANTIYTSTNGITWTTVNPGISYRFYGAAFGNGTFVVVGESGKIVTSSDNGATWTSRTSGTSSSLRGVKYGRRHRHNRHF